MMYQRKWWRMGKGAGLIVALCCTTTLAADWQTAALLSDSSESNADLKNPKVVGSVNGGFHSVWINNAGALRYRRYTTSLQSAQTAATHLMFNPRLAEAPGGQIHAVYESWDGESPEVGWVYSSNGGSSFSSPSILSNTYGHAKFPVIAGFGTGSSNAAVTSYYNTDNKAIRSRYWNGSSWGSVQYVAQGGSEYEVFGIARSPYDGSVYRSFDDDTDYVAMSRYNGSSWGSKINIYNQGFFARQRVAVNDAGQVMVLWDMSFDDGNYYSAVYTPGQGVGSRQVVTGSGTWGTALTAIPGTNDFYTVYPAYSANYVVGKRWSSGSWGSQEGVGIGQWEFSTNPDVSADPNGSGDLYAVWEYWASGRPQIYYSIKEGNVTNPAPTQSSVSLNTTNLVANDSTQYTCTYTCSDASGVSDIIDMRCMFNYAGTPASSRGYLAWGASQSNITHYGGSWTINAASGGGYWGFLNNDYGYQYITPVSCSTSTNGNSRTVVFTFKVKPAWGSTGPATGNFISMWVRDNYGNTEGWNSSSSEFSYTFNVAQAPGAITGTVLDDSSNPVSGATVSTNTGGYNTTTAANGTYTLSNVAVGSYNVTASKSGYDNDTVSNVSVSAGTTTTGVNLTLDVLPGAISGTVLDDSSNPVSGATVSTNTGGYNTTTAANGTYTLSNVTPGTYNVTASKDGYYDDTVSNVSVSAGQTTTGVNLSLEEESAQPQEVLDNGDMEGGWWSTGWGGGSVLPNDWDGWYNPGDFNCFQDTSIKHGGSNSARTYIASGGDAGSGGYKRTIFQNVYVGANASFTFTAWARHTNGNCPSIMCWNDGQNNANPADAYSAGKYQWITTDNWGQLNTWVSRSMTGTAPSGGWITIMVGGAHHGGGGAGNIYVDDCSVTTP